VLALRPPPARPLDAEACLSATRARLRSIRPDERGIQRLHAPGRIDFFGARDLAVGCEAFLSRVDTSRVSTLFRGVAGPAPRVLRDDSRGRPLLQVEPRAVLALPIHSPYAGRVRDDARTLERFDYSDLGRRVWLHTFYDSSDRPDQGALVTMGPGREGNLRLELLSSTRYPRASLLGMNARDRRDWLRSHTSAYAFACSLAHLARRLVEAYGTAGATAIA